MLDMSALEASDARLVPLLSPPQAEELVHSTIPPESWDQLMPHQQMGVLAGVRRGGRVLLADEMGLGKTAQVGHAHIMQPYGHNLRVRTHCVQCLATVKEVLRCCLPGLSRPQQHRLSLGKYPVHQAVQLCIRAQITGTWLLGLTGLMMRAALPSANGQI